ncbi:hypothetical protein QCA50_002955 [Cerrena zonata]|uniref:Hamartin n=1 Tax=Cerrena zonata TaxID=2478898 RepID=A0AAW0GTV7_9APHY
MSSSDLTGQLRLILEKSSDAPSLSALLEYVDVFVKSRADAPDATAISFQVEEDLQTICNDVIDHKVTSQLEVFLTVIFHLHPLLPPLSVISCWFDLVIRPALREPKLATPAVNHAKQLILATLDPDSHSGDNWEDEEKGRYREKVGDFRRRLMDFYLLDAYNESSSDDVLEWASLDDLTREKKACWKANLQDILVKSGLQRPNDLLTETYRCFATPSSRLQLIQLLNAFTSESDFPDRAAHVMGSHIVMQSLIFSLTFDNSTTLCTVSLTMLTKLLPILAVKACKDLKRILPQLFVVLARTICWKQQPRSIFQQLTPEDLGLSAEVIGETVETTEFIDNRNKLPIRQELEWERLDLVFGAAVPIPPSPHQFFQFLYYLFPCNALRFLRFPVLYLAENELESPYTVSWEAALDEDMIRSKAEPLLRGHVVHPLLLWRDASTELARPDFWSEFDISQIVAECTMLDVRNTSLGLRERERQLRDHESSSKTSTTPSSVESTQLPEPISVPALSSSVESSASSVLARMARASTPHKPRISLQEMIDTAVALKSGADIEVVDTTPTWPKNLFRNQAPSSSHNIENSGTATPDTASFLHHNDSSSDDIPSHVAQAIAELQREALLLRSELNFELWMARENVKHIGRLYDERVISRDAEVERQGLHNKMRELKAEVHRLQKELKDHKDQTAKMKNQYLDFNQKLQEKVRELRAEKTSWAAEAAAMRAADKELKDTFTAQQKLLADAMHSVFQLETKMKENAHKIERLHDYELQIEQLVKMQRLWETDVQQLNEQNEYLKIFTSQYKTMELHLETYKSVMEKMETDAKLQRLQTQTLETQLKMSHKQLDVARRMPSQSDLSAYHKQMDALTQANQQLREQNAELYDETEELKAMVESLKARAMGGNRDLISPARSSPLTSHPSPSLF